MAPYLSVGGGALHMTWIERLDGTAARGGSAGKRHRVRFARMHKGAWTSPSTIAEGATIVANWADVPSVALGGDGTLVAHWAEKSSDALYAYDVVLGRSTDRGKSWQRLGLSHDDATQTEHGFVSLVPEGEDVRAFWLDGREQGQPGGAMTLRTALISGEEVVAGEVVDSRVCDCCRTAATSTESGGPMVAYRDRSDKEIRDISTVGFAEDGKWRSPAPIHADGWSISGCPVNGPAVASFDKRVAVAWYSYAEQRSRVRLALSSDGGKTFAPPILVDAPQGRRAPIGRVGVALDGKDAIVSWLASDREKAELLVARVATDGRIGAATTVTQTGAGRDSGFPQLVRIGSDLVFAWTEAGDVAHVRMRRLPIADLAAPAKKITNATDVATGVTVGAAAPELRARTLDGKEVTLASLLGKTVLLNLWATWCEPCRMELRELKKLHGRHRDKNIVVLAVSVDRERTPEEILKFVKRRKLPFVVWHDQRDSASTAFSVSTLPASFVIDPRGKIVWARTGAITADDKDLAGALETAMKTKPD